MDHVKNQFGRIDNVLDAHANEMRRIYNIFRTEINDIQRQGDFLAKCRGVSEASHKSYNRAMMESAQLMTFVQNCVSEKERFIKEEENFLEVAGEVDDCNEGKLRGILLRLIAMRNHDIATLAGIKRTIENGHLHIKCTITSERILIDIKYPGNYSLEPRPNIYTLTLDIRGDCVPRSDGRIICRRCEQTSATSASLLTDLMFVTNITIVNEEDLKKGDIFLPNVTECEGPARKQVINTKHVSGVLEATPQGFKFTPSSSRGKPQLLMPEVGKYAPPALNAKYTIYTRQMEEYKIPEELESAMIEFKSGNEEFNEFVKENKKMLISMYAGKEDVLVIETKANVNSVITTFVKAFFLATMVYMAFRYTYNRAWNNQPIFVLKDRLPVFATSYASHTCHHVVWFLGATEVARGTEHHVNNTITLDDPHALYKCISKLDPDGLLRYRSCC